MNTWNDIEHGFAPARATQYTISDTDQLAATLYKLFHGRYVTSDNGHVITLSDGRHLTITLGDGNTAGITAHTTSTSNSDQDTLTQLRAKADRRIIERAHLHTNTNHAGTITSLSLILFYQGETMPATIRTGYADITTGTFATTRDRHKPLATIRVALTNTQINEWVKREQQALADMLVGETIIAATNGVLTLAGDTGTDEGAGDGTHDADTGALAGEDGNNIVTIHATLNNHKRDNNGPAGGHATTIAPTPGGALGPITHAWVTHTRVQDTREQPGRAGAPQPMIEQSNTNTGAGANEGASTNETTDTGTEHALRRNRRETSTYTLHATIQGHPTPVALYTSVYSGRTAHHGLAIERSDGRAINGEAAATHTTIRLPHK